VSRLIEVPPDRGGGITHILHYYKVNPPPPRPLATLRATVRFASLLARARLGVWLAPSCKHSGARGVNRSSSSLLQGRSLEHQFTLRFAPSLLRSSRRLVIILMSVPSCAGTIVVVYPRAPIVIYELVVRRVPRTQFGSIGFLHKERLKPSIASRAPLEGTNVRPSAISIWYILLNDDRVRTFVLRSAPASVVPLSLFPSFSYFVKTRAAVRWYSSLQRTQRYARKERSLDQRTTATWPLQAASGGCNNERKSMLHLAASRAQKHLF